MLNTMLHPIESLRRISSERDRKAQELEDSINDANDRTHDYKNSTFAERLAAAREEDKLRGMKQKDWVTEEQFQAYDDEGVGAWREDERFRETMEAHREEMAAYEQAGISEAIDQDREAVGIRLAEVYDELDSVDDENSGEIEASEDDETEKPPVKPNKVEKATVKKGEINKMTTKSGGVSNSGWDKSYSGTGERKPGQGLIEGIKGWFKKMFGNSEKK